MSYIFLALLRLFNIATYIPVGSFKQTFIFVWYTPIPRATLQTLLSFLYIIRYTFTLVSLTNWNYNLRKILHIPYSDYFSFDITFSLERTFESFANYELYALTFIIWFEHLTSNNIWNLCRDDFNHSSLFDTS